MGTYKDLQDRINSDYLNRDLGETTKRAIQAAIRDREAERGWYNETATALTCVADQEFLLPPDDYWELDRMEIKLYGQWISLVETDFNSIRTMNSIAQHGQPVWFNYRANRFWLSMIPDSAYPIMCYYAHKIPVLSADTDSNVWTNEGFNLIAHEATLDLLANTLRTDDLMAIQSQKAKRDEALARFMERNAQRMSVCLRQTTF